MGSEFFKYIKLINDKMRKKSDRDLAEHNLSLSQFSLLILLKKFDGQATQKQIEEKLNVSHAATFGIIKRLEEKGYVKSFIDTKDCRNKMVEMTNLGNEKLNFIMNNQESDLVLALSTLSTEEYEVLIELLKKVYKAIEVI